MTIRYDQLHPGDWTSYFEGCIVFYFDGITVVPYRIGGFSSDPDEQEWACDCECVLYHSSDRNNSMLVSIEELLNEPQWLLHRFPIGYLAIDNDTLINISVETNHRRMRKGTTFSELEYHGSLFGEEISDQVPDNIARRLVNYNGQGYSTGALSLAVANVLTYGNNPAMRTNIPINEAKSKANKGIKDMMASEDVNVCVPSFDTALIRHRSTRDVAIVLHNGRLLGRLVYDKENNSTTLFYTLPTYEDKDARRIARHGIELLAVPMIADSVELEQE